MAVVQLSGVSNGIELCRKRERERDGDRSTKREKEKGINLARSHTGAWSPTAEQCLTNTEPDYVPWRALYCWGG